MPSLFNPAILPGAGRAIAPISPLAPLGLGGGGMPVSAPSPTATAPQLSPPLPAGGGESAGAPGSPSPSSDDSEGLKNAWRRVGQRLRETPGASRALLAMSAAFFSDGPLGENLSEALSAASQILEDSRRTALEEGRAERQEAREERSLALQERIGASQIKTGEARVDIAERQVGVAEGQLKLSERKWDFTKGQDQKRYELELKRLGIWEMMQDFQFAQGMQESERKRKLFDLTFPMMEDLEKGKIDLTKAQTLLANAQAAYFETRDSTEEAFLDNILKNSFELAENPRAVARMLLAFRKGMAAKGEEEGSFMDLLEKSEGKASAELVLALKADPTDENLTAFLEEFGDQVTREGLLELINKTDEQIRELDDGL